MKCREIKFCNTINSRFVGNRCNVIRSDEILSFSDDNVSLLIKYNVKAIIDLRSDNEVRKKPFVSTNYLNYYHIPLHENGILPCDGNRIAEFYFQFAKVEKTVYKVLKTIADLNNCGVIYFCRSGKDRTGVITALLLSICGFSDEYIAADYAETEKNMHDIISSWLLTHSYYSKEAVSPMPRHILDFLNLMREYYKSIMNYCKIIGLSDTDIENIQRLII